MTQYIQNIPGQIDDMSGSQPKDGAFDLFAPVPFILQKLSEHDFSTGNPNFGVPFPLMRQADKALQKTREHGGSIEIIYYADLLAAFKSGQTLPIKNPDSAIVVMVSSGSDAYTVNEKHTPGGTADAAAQVAGQQIPATGKPAEERPAKVAAFVETGTSIAQTPTTVKGDTGRQAQFTPRILGIFGQPRHTAFAG